MSLGLSAPAAVAVELRTTDRRVYRLSQELGLGGIRLGRPAPFEPGQPVTIRFTVPGDGSRPSVPLEMTAELVTTGDPAEAGGERGASALYFLHADADARSTISTYIADRLGLPPLPMP